MNIQLLALVAILANIVQLVKCWSPMASPASSALFGRGRKSRKIRSNSEWTRMVLKLIPGDDETVHIADTAVPNGSGQQNTQDTDNSTSAAAIVEDAFSIERSACRVVALSDGKIPVSRSDKLLLRPPDILGKMDYFYHAMAYAKTSQLEYMDNDIRLNEDVLTHHEYDAEEEKKLVTVLRTSLEDAGFALLNQRDLDLADALNSGYLLRLSIVPDVSQLDPAIAKEFYPERFSENETLISGEDEFPYEGRVLVFRRGYSSEVTKGRLLLPKIDYLQATLVQRLASIVTDILGGIERAITISIQSTSRTLHVVFFTFLFGTLARLIELIPSKRYTRLCRMKLKKQAIDVLSDDGKGDEMQENKIFKLGRYGGSKVRFGGSPNPTDALMPFLICEIDDSEPSRNKNSDYGENQNVANSTSTGADHAMYSELNQGNVTCLYDSEKETGGNSRINSPMQLLERVSLSNVVDFFSPQGRRQAVAGFFDKSTLVEPTYEELVVVWRNLPVKPRTKKNVIPPKFVYEAAEIFELEHRLPQIPKPPPEPTPLPLEIRAFDDVPVANSPAVLPKTKLIFRPADAFVFDFISIISFIAVLGSVKFDSPRLDLVAAISVSSLLLRTFFRYSNKLARYDLLVKTFLTSKIAHRGPGAVKYATSEAASQRALRAALTHTWLLQRKMETKSGEEDSILTREGLVKEGINGVNELMPGDRNINIDLEAAFNDLEDLGLIIFSMSDQQLVYVCEERKVADTLKKKWGDMLDRKMSFSSLVGRRNQSV